MKRYLVSIGNSDDPAKGIGDFVLDTNELHIAMTKALYELEESSKRTIDLPGLSIDHTYVQVYDSHMRKVVFDG